jgi:hypothetical protein
VVIDAPPSVCIAGGLAASSAARGVSDPHDPVNSIATATTTRMVGRMPHLLVLLMEHRGAHPGSRRFGANIGRAATRAASSVVMGTDAVSPMLPTSARTISVATIS